MLALAKGDEFECYCIMNQSDENARHYLIDMGLDIKTTKASDINNNREKLDYNENYEDEEDADDADDDDEHPMPCDCGRIKCLIIKATLEKYDNENSNEEEEI